MQTLILKLCADEDIYKITTTEMLKLKLLQET